MKTDYMTTILTVAVHKIDDNPVYGDTATHVSIEDEAGGTFITLKQCNVDLQVGEVRLNWDEVDGIVAAIEMLKNQPGSGQ